MDGKDDSWTTRAADLAVESTVMKQVLAIHPVLLTVPELVREIAGEAASFAERDAVERAIRDLGGIGLLHQQGELVMPTRSALHFSELLDR